MRVIIYDKNPGPGAAQWWLKTFWLIGCFFQKLFGRVDEYYGAASWAYALDWLCSRQGTLESIQYWGHGSPGCVWLAEVNITPAEFRPLKYKVGDETLLWFRTCSTFQGPRGLAFSAALSDMLNCTVAGHTRIIGVLQGGLHTRKPHSYPSWSTVDGEFPASWWPPYLRWGDNTVTCLATKIPEGW